GRGGDARSLGFRIEPAGCAVAYSPWRAVHFPAPGSGMKVFVTGATGYLGSHIARAFRRAGHEVWGLVRNQAKVRALEEAEIRPVLGTLHEPGSFLSAAERCELLVH